MLINFSLSIDEGSIFAKRIDYIMYVIDFNEH